MRAARVVAPEQTFGVHDLHQLEDGCVSDGPAVLVDPLENVPHGAWPSLPENREDGKFGIGRLACLGGHVVISIYEALRIVNEKIRSFSICRPRRSSA